MTPLLIEIIPLQNKTNSYNLVLSLLFLYQKKALSWPTSVTLRRINSDLLPPEVYPAQLSGVGGVIVIPFFKYQKKALSWRRPTLPLRVPSALMGLTSEFGMGSGIPPPQKPPR